MVKATVLARWETQKGRRFVEVRRVATGECYWLTGANQASRLYPDQTEAVVRAALEASLLPGQVVRTL